MLNVRMVKRGKAGRIGRRRRNARQGRGVFPRQLSPGDTFIFAGKVLRFEGIRENECLVSQGLFAGSENPSYAGGKFPLSTYLADQVRSCWPIPSAGIGCPIRCATGCACSSEKSMLPKRDELLIETFPRGSRFYMVAYPFEGRLAHQTLGMLLTRRLERAGAKPLGFVATDYSLASGGSATWA
jgi:ATP-dependent Lhr-like helicase